MLALIHKLLIFNVLSFLHSKFRSNSLEQVKRELLQRVRELMYQCDQTMKAVTVGYWQLMHTITAAEPTQFQHLADNARLYEPGSQYAEFVGSLRDSPSAATCPSSSLFSFVPYDPDHSAGSTIISAPIAITNVSASSRTTATDSTVGATTVAATESSRVKPTSDSDSAESAGEDVPSHGRLTGANVSSGEELDELPTNLVTAAALTHRFRQLRTPSRCRECDNICFQGIECVSVGFKLITPCLIS